MLFRRFDPLLVPIELIDERTSSPARFTWHDVLNEIYGEVRAHTLDRPQEHGPLVLIGHGVWIAKIRDRLQRFSDESSMDLCELRILRMILENRLKVPHGEVKKACRPTRAWELGPHTSAIQAVGMETHRGCLIGDPLEPHPLVRFRRAMHMGFTL